ncbi:MAG TPA: hypothetical protein VHA77_11445 [Xanthobacteraceae bacterium]|jgi:hypothetical protein|nr:hypothetical protein [Xanthobacteraceae bacterium]
MTFQPTDLQTECPVAVRLDESARGPEVIAMLPEPDHAGEEHKVALLPILLLGLGIVLTISWNALLLWQFIKGLIFLIGYAFS